MPDCHQPTSLVNREGQAVCADHEAVVISTSGVPDRHARTSGE
jgi:hypothetical protein